MNLKDKAALITTIIKVVSNRLGVDAAACLQPSSHYLATRARIFITQIMIRNCNLSCYDVIDALNYKSRANVCYDLTRKPDAKLMHTICTEIAEQLKVSKTSVQTTDSRSEFLKSDLTTFSGYLQP